MRVGPIACGLVCTASLLTSQTYSQEPAREPARPQGLGCMTCTANAPGRPASPAAADLPPIVPREAAEIEMALGRLRLVRDRFKIVSKHEAFPEAGGYRSLQVAFHHGQPSLSATYSDTREKWSLQLDAIVGAQWSREYLEDGRPMKVVYSQRPYCPIEIEVTGMSARGSKMSGLSLWHLLRENPLGFSTCVVPSLERLNPSWKLHETLATAGKTTLASEQQGELIDIDSVKQCVIDLEAGDRQVRAAALERLRALGLAAHIPLQQLLQDDLGVQQRQSIERLLDSLEPRSADTPTRLAYWLSGDSAWR